MNPLSLAAHIIELVRNLCPKSNSIENFLTTNVSLTSLSLTKGVHHAHHTENYNINFLIGTLTIVKKPNWLIRGELT